MDFVAHLLWSGILFAGPLGWWAVLLGGLPDLIPFGSATIKEIFQKNNKENPETLNGKTNDRTESMISHYNRPENQWVYKVYNYSHSLVIWGILFLIILSITRNFGIFPIFMFAWLLHILIDIPTHRKVFFAPQFLTPFSKFCVDGKSWAHPTFMKINYSIIIIGVILQTIY